jgi:hypothetical protein
LDNYEDIICECIILGFYDLIIDILDINEDANEFIKNDDGSLILPV